MDATFKAIFSHAIMMRELLGWFVADLHGARGLVDALDLSRLRRRQEQSVSGPPADLHGYASDLVWEAPFARPLDADPNAWQRLVLPCEFQRTPDRAMPVRVRNYVSGQHMAELRRRDGRLRRTDWMPPVLPIVIYAGTARWSAPGSVMELVTPGVAPAMSDVGSRSDAVFAGEGYLPLDILRLRSEDFRDDNAASLLAALTRPDPQQAAGRATALLSQLPGPGLRDLRRLCLQWVRQESHLNLGVDDMDALESLAPADRQDFFEEKVVLWHERFHAEGRVAGLAEGRVAGLAEGRVAGLAEGTRNTLRRQAARKFGAGAGERLAALLAHVEDAGRLARIGDWIVDCNSGDALFARIARAGNGR